MRFKEYFYERMDAHEDQIQKLKDFMNDYESYIEFEDDVLIHVTNVKSGEIIEYVEPKAGDFTKSLYGTDDIPELAFFKSSKELFSKIKHYATGVNVFKKTGIPVLLIVEKPDDILHVGDDSEEINTYGEIVSHNAPITAEPGDYFSEEGASVISQIPFQFLDENNIKTLKDLWLKLRT